MRSIPVRRLVLAGLVLAAFGANAQTQVANRFTPVDAADALAATKLPPGLDTTPISVVVMLSGESVAAAQEKTGAKLAHADKNAIKAQRTIEQNAIKPQIEAKGGRVIGSFQSILNGVKVKIARNQIDSLRSIPGVVSVKPVNRYERDNVIGVPRTKAPLLWASPGYHGENIKVAVIDTGIDFTHANFGGPGTVAAYQAAKATNTLPANPALFGPNAPKVKGGIDLAGDAYDANDPTSVPKPDPNPLDCDEDVGHGSHVSGTVAGFGVLSTGATYTGAYDATTYNNSFRIGPGVAPRASLYGVRVFGCVGSTELVVDALEWAVDHDMDVVNMSLGSSYGTGDSADADATNAAVKAGIAVVTSAGNSGDLKYITGSPGTANRAVSVAAADTPSTVPFANIALPLAGNDAAVNLSSNVANGASFTSPMTLPLKVVHTGTAVSLGCSVADFQADGGVVGKIAVVLRGTCGRVAKAIYGQQAGAAAVIMINNATSLPPYEGIIFQNPDTGAFYDVTIPFFGVKGLVTTATSDGGRLVLRDGQTITITSAAPQKTGTATFSSVGPRNGDSSLKPDVTGPGSPIISTLAGSGNLQESLSGTSMASPHVAGVAALVRQAHPAWTPAEVKAAIINTASTGELADYVARRNGSGFVDAENAAKTRVVAYANKNTVSMSFGLQEFTQVYTDELRIVVANDGNLPATFDVAAVSQQGSPHTIALDKTSITVPANGKARVWVTITVPAATAGNSDDYRDASGLIRFTPKAATDNVGIALSVPYLVVPRVSSNVTAKLDTPITPTSTTANMLLANTGGAIAATGDFYTWGLQGTGTGNTSPDFSMSSAGAQTFDASATQKGIAFAINMNQAWSSPNMREFDVHIDTNGDGITDYVLVCIDIGLITTGAFDGRMVGALYKRNANNVFEQTTIDFLASASTDGSSIVVPILASSLGITAANPRLSYNVVAFNFDTGDSDVFPKAAKYNAITPAISNGDFVSIAANGTKSVPISVNLTELALTPALGSMVLTPDNRNGPPEANLVPIKP